MVNGSHAKLRMKHQNRDLQNSSWNDKIYWNYRRNHRRRTESILDKKNPYLQARAICINKFRQPVKKENILQKKVVVKISKL